MIFRIETKNKTSKRKHADADSLEVFIWLELPEQKTELAKHIDLF